MIGTPQWMVDKWLANKTIKDEEALLKYYQQFIDNTPSKVGIILPTGDYLCTLPNTDKLRGINDSKI